MGYDKFLKNKKGIDMNNVFGKDSINISSQIDSTISNGSKINYLANFTLNPIGVIFIIIFLDHISFNRSRKIVLSQKKRMKIK